MNTLQEIENHLVEKQEKANNKSNDFNEKLNEARKNVLTFDEQLQQAKQEGDTEKYLQLKAEKRKAIDVVEMYSDNESNFISEPLLTNEEYKQIKSNIVRIANEVGEQQLNEANILVNKLKIISDEITNNYVTAKKLIRIANDGKDVFSEQYQGNKAMWITKEINILSNQVKHARGES
ncbi:hypothetical protein [Vagococcus fluvialis]|uniref:Uncharacterized protein n=1 Tax=Vagococcus fluvialis TaxID=2738 RepID=A0A7X6I1S4_9ENTE|nr:hypothetical protein [Vagococcus fluvialis]NKC66728.1 hypothetical protein [Vagococcus fluvialis]